jgi:hypothetical protein
MTIAGILDMFNMTQVSLTLPDKSNAGYYKSLQCVFDPPMSSVGPLYTRPPGEEVVNDL